MKELLSYISLILTLASCENHALKESPDPIHKYLHIAHTRTDINPTLDSFVEKINFDKYNMLWLGGDLAKTTSIDDESMVYIDSIFDLKNETTLWALGNHDYSSLERIEKFTDRAPYYSYQKNKLTIVVLDTQDSLSHIVGDQKHLLFDVLDTIQRSTHLILLHHKLVWMYGNEDLEPKANSISNGRLGDCFHCINPNNFYTDIYPRLLEVKKKGIEVICIGGDIGFKSAEFEYLTPEGIYFLASGIAGENGNNKALVFEHNISKGTLSWSFQAIDNL